MVVYWGPGHVHAVKARPNPQLGLALPLMPVIKPAATSCSRCLRVMHRTWKDTENKFAAGGL